MKMKHIFYSACLVLVLFSCKSRPSNDLNYMQNIEQTATQLVLANSTNFIQPGDQLVIMVTARDMEVAKPFNQNYSSGNTAQYSLPSSNLPTASQTTVSGPTYVVDSESNIYFPYIGKMSVAGKTIEMFRDELRNKLTAYIKDPGINIRHANYKITVLGEVRNPGTFVVPDGNATLLSALGLAGDLTIHGKRDNVLVLRKMNDEVVKKTLDLRDAGIISSDFYQLKQNDVIVVAANESKQKESRMNPNTPLYIGAAGIIVTILGVIFSK